MRLLLFLFIGFFTLNTYAKTLLQNAQSYTTKEFKIVQVIKVKKHLREISDIAYEPSSGLLYAIGDKGDVYHLRPLFKDETLVDVVVEARYGLKLKKPMKKVDSEGLALFGDKLAISFEREPKIILFSKKGQEIAEVLLPPILKDPNTYKGKNQMLEALAFKKGMGLICAPQSSHTKYHTVYNLTKMTTQRFTKSTQLSAFEFTPKNNLLAIERVVSKSKKEAKKTKELLLKHVKMNTKGEVLKSKVIVRFKDDAAITKNYEGLSYYKDNLYFMMNDNDDKEETYLVLFKFDEK